MTTSQILLLLHSAFEERDINWPPFKRGYDTTELDP